MTSYSSYFAFGSQQPGLNGADVAYRYGMNGQEKENEVYDANGTASSAEYWMYDSRLGRRWNIDPLYFDWQSTYAVNNNNPVFYTDYNGLYGSQKKAERKMEKAEKRGKEVGGVYQNDKGNWAYKSREKGETWYSHSFGGLSEVWKNFKSSIKKNIAKRKEAKAVNNHVGEIGDDGYQTINIHQGNGNVQIQQYEARMKSSMDKFEILRMTLLTTPQKILNNSSASFYPADVNNDGALSAGDRIDIDIWGPDNGGVRVAKVHNDANSVELYFQTLRHHPEAGQIRFRAEIKTINNEDVVIFSISSMTRLNFNSFSLAFTGWWARKQQQNSWIEVLGNFKDFMGNDVYGASVKVESYNWVGDDGLEEFILYLMGEDPYIGGMQSSSNKNVIDTVNKH